MHSDVNSAQHVVPFPTTNCISLLMQVLALPEDGEVLSNIVVRIRCFNQY